MVDIALIIVGSFSAGILLGVGVNFKPKSKQWCVFDRNSPDNQTIVSAPDANTALAIAARQVFDLDVEEV